MITLLHISDLHFGPPHYAEAAEAVLRSIRQIEPDAVVASGDFTQRAKEEQFQAARRYLDRLPEVPLVSTPGNHDIPVYRLLERLFSPYDLYRKYISRELDTVTELPGTTIVSLNSTAPLRAVTNGRVSGSQLDFARRAFATSGEDHLRVIVSHHHFAPPPDFEGADVMPKARRALDAFSEMNVDLILGGHLHRGYIGNSLDVYSGTRREYGIVIAQCGTTTSRRGRAREREKNSFNVVRLDTHVIRVSHYMYFDEEDGFVPTSRHIFFRGGRASHPHHIGESPLTHESGVHLRLPA
ncbi:MAG: metallophosphoesterase family protein [Longimicrobiaceae bacterium]